MQAYHQYGVGSRLFFLIPKRVQSTRSASDKVYQLLAQGRWFSPCISDSSTTKTGRHDIAEMLLKVALNTKNQINQIKSYQKYRYLFNCLLITS